MKEIIKEILEESIKTKQKVIKTLIPNIEKTANLMINCLKSGHKILVCGNGGSAADAQHFTAELVGRFQKERKGLACIALTTDTSIITAWTNDYGYDTLFARQIESLGKEGDLLIGISTSGNSENIIQAFEIAKKMNISCVGLLGKDGGKMKDIEYIKKVIVPGDNTARIQESHMAIYHIWCELIENALFP